MKRFNETPPRRRRLPALFGLILTFAGAPAFAGPGRDPEELEEEEYEEYDDDDDDDDDGYLMVSPGLVQLTPVPGDASDVVVGYQWGLHAGALLRTDGFFAIGLGGAFEHGITDLGITTPDTAIADHQFRVQFEAMPGFAVVNERVFVHLTLGLGYVGWLRRWGSPGRDVNMLVDHGIVFSPGVGINARVKGNFAVGAQIGGDLQWFDPTGTDFESHNVDVKVLLGWVF